MQECRNMKMSLFYFFLQFFFPPWTIFFLFLFTPYNVFFLELKTTHLLNLNCTLSMPMSPWEPLHIHSLSLCVSPLHLSLSAIEIYHLLNKKPKLKGNKSWDSKLLILN